MLDGARGKVLYSKRENRKAQPASTVKVLTALVVAENLPMDKVVTVPDGTVAIPASKINAKPGERYKVKDLLKALLLSSANDAAYTLAIATAGSQAAFCQMMNDRAKRLGAKQSYFTTPHGLPDDRQYTTTKDLALIMREAERNPALVSIMHQKTTVIYSEAGRKIYLRNHNKLLWRDKRDIIGKTGWTRKARHCFVGRIATGGKVLFFAIMGSIRPWNDLSVLINAFAGKGQKLTRQQYHQGVLSEADRKKIQGALKKAGFYQGTIDGKFGKGTQRAISKFQKANKLKSDGIIGASTYKALEKYF
jgi:D-alanyl-D-alanine carboxypeptidase (penicillin-binding protein 5/6)